MRKPFSYIPIQEDTKLTLIKLKVHHKETFDDVVKRLIETNESK